jgi:putative colanic acid biosynthesis acetyltransferase WcaF
LTREGRLRPPPGGQSSRTASPWPLGTRLGVALWWAARLLLFRPTPPFLNGWRLLLLRLFGARVEGRPFVAASATVRMPWQLTLEEGSCLGANVEVYNLGRVTLRRRSLVAQHSYLCGGTHDLADLEGLPVLVGDIDVGADAFVGARATVLPGVRIGEGAVVGAGGVVREDVEPWTVCVGNPCRPIGRRRVRERS